MHQTLSILILTHNRAEDLLALLISLSEQLNFDGILKEILILNNASTDSYDEVIDFIKKHPELCIEYIYSQINTGVAKGRNILMQRAKGDILLTIDDDMIFPQKDAFIRMSKIFDKPYFKESNTAIITLRVIYYSTKETQETAFPHKSFNKYYGKKEFLTYYFAGGANLMKRELINQVGLFPEDFFYGMEEYDLCYRVLGKGFRMGYEDSIIIEHKESPYGRQANYKKIHMQWINKAKVAWRYLPFIYFLSTSLLWSFQYLIHASGHFGLYFKSWGYIFRIPFSEKRKVISKETLRYLHNVEARLWF